MGPVSPANYIPVKRISTLLWVDSVLKNAAYSKYASMSPAYSLLKEQLQRDSTIEKDGGWENIPGKLIKIYSRCSQPGKRSLKKDCKQPGNYPGGMNKAIAECDAAAFIIKLFVKLICCKKGGS